MVKEYLENYQDELIQEKIILEKKCLELEIKIRETMQFLIVLEKENEKGLESFTPRIYANHDKKIEKLKKEQEELQIEIEQTAHQLSDINSKLAELSSIIKVARQNEISDKKFINSENNSDIIKLKFLETQELERQRIARELHDSTVQNLTGMVYKTELCSKLMDVDPEKCKQELLSISKTIHRIINEMRELIYDLRPMSYDDMGLSITVEKEISRLKKSGEIELHYEVEGNLDNIKPVISLTILRVVQEACNNILKHASAKNVNVSFIRTNEELTVEIEDDGKGFDIGSLQNMVREDYSGFGLSMMHERIFLLSGCLDIKSEVNKGTKIKVVVPLNH